MQRNWIRTALIVCACVALQAARKDFWEMKDASVWSDEEKQRMLVQSPWAKVGFVRMEAERKTREGPYGPNSSPKADMPASQPGSHAVQLGGEMPPVPNADPGSPVQFRVTARWETAKPVRLAGRPELPELAGQFYVIRLHGLPLMPPPKVKPGEVAPNPNEGMLEAIRQGSRLERKDKPGIRCSHLFVGSGGLASDVLLFFPREPITVADKLVTVESRFSAFHLSIKFPLKDMLYEGELAL